MFLAGGEFTLMEMTACMLTSARTEMEEEDSRGIRYLSIIGLS